MALISHSSSVSQARFMVHALQSARPLSTLVVSQVTYAPSSHSFLGPSSSFPSPTPTLQNPVIGRTVFKAEEVGIRRRDDIGAPSGDSLMSSSSTAESTSSLLLSPATTPVSVQSQSPADSSSGSTVPLSAVVGGAVGGGVVLVAFITFVFFTRRRRGGPRIEPFPIHYDVEHHQSGDDRDRQMSQHSRPLPDVPTIRPPIPRQNQHPSAHPLLRSGAKVHPLYDLKVTVSETSLHSGTTAPETPLSRTYSHNCDAISVMSRESDRRRHRPLPRPPGADTLPPVPALPRDVPRPRPRPQRDEMALTVQPAALSVPSQSLASSGHLTSPISPLDIDLGDYTTGPGTSPPTFLPARRDSQLEPLRTCTGIGIGIGSPRRLPAPPSATSPSAMQGPSMFTSDADAEAEGDMEMEMVMEGMAGVNLQFDADGRPDSPSVARMYKELLELQRQVAWLREDIPARHFGEAPPDYAESVVGSTCV